MFKRLVSFGLVAILLHTTYAVPVWGLGHAGQEQSPVERVKSQVAKRGLGKKVTVQLKNGSKLKGYISKIESDSFEVTNPKTAQATSIAYADVTQVQGQGGLSLIAKVGIGFGIVVGALALLYAIGCGGNAYC
jgi:hypothetical protein